MWGFDLVFGKPFRLETYFLALIPAFFRKPGIFMFRWLFFAFLCSKSFRFWKDFIFGVFPMLFDFGYNTHTGLRRNYYDLKQGTN